jgi:hypothetical protein
MASSAPPNPPPAEYSATFRDSGGKLSSGILVPLELFDLTYCSRNDEV